MTEVIKNSINLYEGDCLEKLKLIKDGSIDMILTDPPYGTVKNMNYKQMKQSNSTHEWDIVIDTSKILEECNRVLRVNGCLILFSQQPYTTELISNAHNNVPFSYCLTWKKNIYGHALLANKAPLNYTEDIVVYFKKYDSLALNPLREYFKKLLKYINLSLSKINETLKHRKAEHCFYIKSTQFGLCPEEIYNELKEKFNIKQMNGYKSYKDLVEIDKEHKKTVQKIFNLEEGKKHKSNILEYKKEGKSLHPTQKPVALLEDLIKTYTNENQTVLDFTMGSGSTCIAAMNTKRNCIGIELDNNYFNVSSKRIEDHNENLDNKYTITKHIKE